MQSGYRIILNIFLITAAFLAIGLLIFQDDLYASKSLTNDLGAWAKGINVAPDIAASDKALEHPALGNLKNYVVNFDFNRVCWRPGAPACTPGNRLPFLVKPDESAVPAPVEVKPVEQ